MTLRKFRAQPYLRELLNLAICPQSKETKKCNSKGNKEHRLNTEKASRLNDFDSAIVEYVLVGVGVLVDLIHYVTNQIIGSRLQGHKSIRYSW